MYVCIYMCVLYVYIYINIFDMYLPTPTRFINFNFLI